MSETTAPAIATVKHINQKTGGVNPREAVKQSKSIYMGRVFGVTTDVKHFEDKAGDPKTYFVGEFRFIAPDGAQSESEKLYMFKALEEKMESVFKSGGEKAVEFGYDIFAAPDDKAGTGYVYQAKTLLATATSDRLGKLTSQLAETAMPGVETESAKPATKAAGKK